MFEAKCKLYTKEMNPKPMHKSLIAAGDMLKLRGYFSEGLDSNDSWADPERLVQFVWFSLCFHFGRRGREGWRELSKPIIRHINRLLWSPICDRNTDRTNKELSRRVEAKGPRAFMENISSKAELSERYTNHCSRASTITALYQRGVDAKQICVMIFYTYIFFSTDFPTMFCFYNAIYS